MLFAEKAQAFLLYSQAVKTLEKSWWKIPLSSYVQILCRFFLMIDEHGCSFSPYWASQVLYINA